MTFWQLGEGWVRGVTGSGRAMQQGDGVYAFYARVVCVNMYLFRDTGQWALDTCTPYTCEVFGGESGAG